MDTLFDDTRLVVERDHMTAASIAQLRQTNRAEFDWLNTPAVVQQLIMHHWQLHPIVRRLVHALMRQPIPHFLLAPGPPEPGTGTLTLGGVPWPHVLWVLTQEMGWLIGLDNADLGRRTGATLVRLRERYFRKRDKAHRAPVTLLKWALMVIDAAHSARLARWPVYAYDDDLTLEMQPATQAAVRVPLDIHAECEALDRILARAVQEDALELLGPLLEFASHLEYAPRVHLQGMVHVDAATDSLVPDPPFLVRTDRTATTASLVDLAYADTDTHPWEEVSTSIVGYWVMAGRWDRIQWLLDTPGGGDLVMTDMEVLRLIITSVQAGSRPGARDFAVNVLVPYVRATSQAVAVLLAAIAATERTELAAATPQNPRLALLRELDALLRQP